MVEKTSSNFFYYAFIITAEHKYRNQGESWFGFVWEVAKSTYWDLKYANMLGIICLMTQNSTKEIMGDICI